MAIKVKAAGFKSPYTRVNAANRVIEVDAIDIARAAATVGGPVGGTPWASTERVAGIVHTVLAALSEEGPAGPLVPSSLFEELESTEKGGVSFRLGMAMTAIVAEELLDIQLLEHLNARNSRVSPSGGQRRADLFGLDTGGRCHVIEAKARTHGYGKDLVDYAKSRAENVTLVDTARGPMVPMTKSASITDLSQKPIHVLLQDPDGAPEREALYEFDLDAVIGSHYALVPNLIEAGGRSDPPRDPGIDAVGAYLPGTKVWLGLRSDLYRPSELSWLQRISNVRSIPRVAAPYPDSTSIGRDGHVLQFGDALSIIYERWRATPRLVVETERSGETPEST